MRILHLLSQTQVTGAETYAASLSDIFIKRGHDVTIVSDTFQTPTVAEVILHPIAERGISQRLKNERFVNRLLRERNFDIIHAHSRASSWIAHFASFHSGATYISTVHGRQHLHLSTWLYNIYGNNIIAICENIRTHLINEVKIPTRKIALIPNGVAFPESITANSVRDRNVTLVGRCTGPKGERFADFFEQVAEPLLQEDPTLQIKLIGGKFEQLRPSAQVQIQKLHQKYRNRITALGHMSSAILSNELRSAGVVIAAGRVTIEALSYDTPTIALGEGDYQGLIAPNNWEVAAHSNFGDINSVTARKTLDYREIQHNIERAFAAPPPSVRSEIVARYGLNKIAELVEEFYYERRMRKLHPHSIPILMYHRTSEQPLSTTNRTFVTKQNLERHFRFFRSRRFTPITFSEYLQFRIGKLPKKSFPQRLVILTFDDGYRNNFVHLLPLMKKYCYRGVIFALGDPAKTSNDWDANEPEGELMSAGELRAFVEHGCEIGAHTLTHRDLTVLIPGELQHELTESKRYLSETFGTPVVSFAYPFGCYNDTVKTAVKGAGFTFGVATDSGGMTIEDDRYAIFRVNMFPEENWFSLYKKTANWYRGYYLRKRGK